MINPVDKTIDLYINAILERKAQSIVVLNVGNLTSFADTFIICSAKSNRQVTAIGEHVLRLLKKQGVKSLSVEGLKEGHWVLIDYGDVIIHIFYEPIRSFYNLEGLWSDAKRIDVEQPSNS